jgi:hypothetical protein
MTEGLETKFQQAERRLRILTELHELTGRAIEDAEHAIHELRLQVSGIQPTLPALGDADAPK